jgi:fucose permease
MVPLANLLRFLRVPLPAMVPEDRRTPLADLFGARAFLAALLLMTCAGAAELTMSQWSSLFAEQGLGLPKVYGDLAGPCLFAALMGLGRFAYGLWGDALPLRPALAACGALATACYLVAALSGAPALSLAGCALCGLAVSLLWPGTFSLTTRAFPFGGAAMFAVLAVFGDLGGAIGPWIAGAVADVAGSGLRAGLLAGTAFPLLVVLTAAGLRTRGPRAG